MSNDRWARRKRERRAKKRAEEEAERRHEELKEAWRQRHSVDKDETEGLRKADDTKRGSQ